MVMDSVNTMRALGNQVKLVPLEHKPSYIQRITVSLTLSAFKVPNFQECILVTMRKND